jgi:hypothetical protein
VLTIVTNDTRHLCTTPGVAALSALAAGAPTLIIDSDSQAAVHVGSDLHVTIAFLPTRIPGIIGIDEDPPPAWIDRLVRALRNLTANRPTNGTTE